MPAHSARDYIDLSAIESWEATSPSTSPHWLSQQQDKVETSQRQLRLGRCAVRLSFLRLYALLRCHITLRSASGKVSLDALKEESQKLKISPENQLDYIAAQIMKETEHLLQLKLEKKEAEKVLQLEKKEAEKVLAVTVEKKEAEKVLELAMMEAEHRLQITKTGLLWMLRTQTQRHAYEMFLMECWGKMQELSKDEIQEIRKKIDKFPKTPAKSTVSAAH